MKVDYKKPFDTIHRNRMFQILSAYGIPKIIVGAISTLYNGTKAKVMTPAGDTTSFNIISGFIQNNTLVPYLVIIVLNN